MATAIISGLMLITASIANVEFTDDMKRPVILLLGWAMIFDVLLIMGIFSGREKQ